MKKLISVLAAAALMLSLAACSSKPDSSSQPERTNSPEDAAATGTYTVYNTTGETVTELYLALTGTEKGENLAGDGLADGESVVLTYTGNADDALTLSFKTEGGYEAAYETLYVEEAPVSLLSEDAAAGATPISFTQPE